MTIEEEIRALIEGKKYPDCAKLLLKNTGKEKAIDPNNIKDMESKYRILFDPLRKEGEYMHLRVSAHSLKTHLKDMEKTDIYKYEWSGHGGWRDDIKHLTERPILKSTA